MHLYLPQYPQTEQNTRGGSFGGGTTAETYPGADGGGLATPFEEAVSTISGGDRRCWSHRFFYQGGKVLLVQKSRPDVHRRFLIRMNRRTFVRYQRLTGCPPPTTP